MINVDLDKPIALLGPLYPMAVVHALVQRRQGRDINLYTTIVYITPEDGRSVPRSGDEKVVSTSDEFRVLRQRMASNDAAAFVADAAAGMANVAGCDVQYDVGEPDVTFRAASGIGLAPNRSLFGSSTWGRERLARSKALDGIALGERTIAEIASRLAKFDLPRCSPSPLHRFPEKLGDLDEFWPSPLSCATRREATGTSVMVEWTVASPPSGVAVSTRLDLYNNVNMRTATVTIDGLGSHAIDERFDANEAEVSIDGIPVERVGGVFLKGVGIAFGIDNDGDVEVGQNRSGGPFKLHVTPRTVMRTVAGEMPQAPKRFEAQRIGDFWRNEPPGPNDVERLYLPSVPNPVHAALQSLQEFGRHETGAEIRVVDPYALNETAMDAIAAIASGHEAGTTIVVLTEMAEARDAHPTFWNAALKLLRKIVSAIAKRLGFVGESRRDVTTRTLRPIAAAVAKRFGVRIVVRLATGISLHDRFLFVGRRVWHVGHSFNALGSGLSMIVEIRDGKVKRQLIDTLEPLFTNGEELIDES